MLARTASRPEPARSLHAKGKAMRLGTRFFYVRVRVCMPVCVQLNPFLFPDTMIYSSLLRPLLAVFAIALDTKNH